MPTFQFNLEEEFSGYLINWDAVRKFQSYREPWWRTWIRNLKAKLSNNQVKQSPTAGNR